LGSYRSTGGDHHLSRSALLWKGTRHEKVREGDGGGGGARGVDGRAVLAETINGTAKDDSLEGTPNADYISGRAGDDELVGGRGKDTVWGDFGDDTIYGWAGDDTLIGWRGYDRIVGGEEMFGDDGNDSIGDAVWLQPQPGSFWASAAATMSSTPRITTSRSRTA